MENATTQQLIDEAISAPIEALEKKKKDAEEKATDIKTRLTEATTSRSAVSKRIKDSGNELKALGKLTDSVESITQAVNMASSLAENVSGADIAKNLADAAISVKTALESVDKAHPEAKAMESKVKNVDVKKNDPVGHVEEYSNTTEDAARLTEKWKKSKVKMAIDHSSSLKLDVDGALAKIADLTSAVETMGKDVEASISAVQALIDADSKELEESKTKVDGIQLEQHENNRVQDTVNKLIDASKNTEAKPEAN